VGVFLPGFVVVAALLDDGAALALLLLFVSVALALGGSALTEGFALRTFFAPDSERREKKQYEVSMRCYARASATCLDR